MSREVELPAAPSHPSVNPFMKLPAAHSPAILLNSHPSVSFADSLPSSAQSFQHCHLVSTPSRTTSASAFETWCSCWLLPFSHQHPSTLPFAPPPHHYHALVQATSSSPAPATSNFVSLRRGSPALPQPLTVVKHEHTTLTEEQCRGTSQHSTTWRSGTN